MSGVAPDYAEPLAGWRLWVVVADGGCLWLESPLYPARWSPRRPLEARCLPHRRSRFASRSACDYGVPVSVLSPEATHRLIGPLERAA